MKFEKQIKEPEDTDRNADLSGNYMKKYSIRGKLFAVVGKNMNNRLAVFRW